MPRVSSVSKRRRSLAAVYFDEPFYARGREYGADAPLLIDLSLWAELGYGVGAAFDDAEIEALLRRSDERRAKEKALRLLSARDYAGAELERRLSRDIPGEAARAAAARMRELGLIDDEAYAARLARDLLFRKYLSARAAVSELTGKGIGRESAKAAVEAAGADSAEQIQAFVLKKFAGWREDERLKNRMLAALARKGYSGAEVREALSANAE